LLLGTVSAVGNFFIVLFLGLAFARAAGVYRNGLLFMAPARHRAARNHHRRPHRRDAGALADRADHHHVRGVLVTWIGLAIIGIQSSFILGIQAGLLAFIPTVGALLGGLIVVLASLASGWVAAPAHSCCSSACTRWKATC
jgi:predicted PurR-regulated permease PerM